MILAFKVLKFHSGKVNKILLNHKKYFCKNSYKISEIGNQNRTIRAKQITNYDWDIKKHSLNFQYQSKNKPQCSSR